MRMVQSVLLAFALFLQKHGYSTSMWEDGYTPDDANLVCREMAVFAHDTLGLQGDFIVLWAQSDGIVFSGDSEFAYCMNDRAYLMPNPFIEGDSEGFVASLLHIVNGASQQLYEVFVRHRVLYNAI
ncbi:MAG: hypothetical protein ACYCYO_03135 [Bacilli bacterium]